MDAYIKPILISTLVVLVLSKVIVLPLLSSPFVLFFIAGAVAVMLFRMQFKNKGSAEIDYMRVIKDIAILGFGTGLVASGILALMFALELQNEQTRDLIVKALNEATKMHSNPDIPVLTELPLSLMLVGGIVTMAIFATCSFFGSFFSSLLALVFSFRYKK